MYVGKHVMIKGYMKTENVTNGYAGLWARVDGDDGTLVINNMKPENIHGTTDWKEYTIYVYLTEESKSIYFGGLLIGEGKMWIDDLNIYIDNKKTDEAKIKPVKTSITQIDSVFATNSGFNLNEVTPQQIENLTVLGKTWGFIKYFHPAIATEKYNMDEELFRVLPKIINCKTKDDRSEILLQWIEKFGEVKSCKSCKEPKAKDIHYSTDLKWISNDSLMTKGLSEKLNYIKNNRKQGKHFYIEFNKNIGNPEFKHENAYAEIHNPDAGYKLLCLYRYWNMIQYFFPYKDIIGEDWNNILPQFIPKFISSNDSIKYLLTTLELISQIHDTHANIWGNVTLEAYKGLNYSPALVKFIEEKAIVSGFFNDELKEKSLLKVGDIITSVNTAKTENVAKQKLPYTPASNYPTQLREISRNLLRSNTYTLNVSVLRNNKNIDLEIPLYESSKMNIYKDFSGATDTCFKFINSEIGYFNLGKIKQSYVSGLIKQCKNTKGIIIDLRNYPSEFMVFELDKYLLQKPTAFVKFTTGNTNYPGFFYWGKEQKNGKRNSDFYPGKVIILINEITQSQAEYTTMALRTGPNTTVIGSTTAGADGNVSIINLPGGIKTMISGLGVFYPDGKPTQRIGIVPDIEVKPTIKGITEGRDELVEKAIELINNFK
jgi:C-terminal processing protease CtpA/Prc